MPYEVLNARLCAFVALLSTFVAANVLQNINLALETQVPVIATLCEFGGRVLYQNNASQLYWGKMVRHIACNVCINWWHRYFSESDSRASSAQFRALVTPSLSLMPAQTHLHTHLCISNSPASTHSVTDHVFCCHRCDQPATTSAIPQVRGALSACSDQRVLHQCTASFRQPIQAFQDINSCPGQDQHTHPLVIPTFQVCLT